MFKNEAYKYFVDFIFINKKCHMAIVFTVYCTTTGFLKTSQAGFDWFVATVFLITRGSLQLTLNTLQEISCLLTSAYLWPSRVHKSVSLYYSNYTIA